jgi:hypothetical protein
MAVAMPRLALALAPLAPAAARAGDCPAPPFAPRTVDARDDGTHDFARPPFAVLGSHGLFISDCPGGCSVTGLVDRECGLLAGQPVAIAGSVGDSGAAAELSSSFANGSWNTRPYALVPSDAVVDGGIGDAGSYTQLGFHDIFDVTSNETAPVPLRIDFDFDGTWTTRACFQGIGAFPPVVEVQLTVRNPISGKLVDYDVLSGPFEAAIHETFAFDANPSTVLRLYLYVVIQAFADTSEELGDDFCFGAESLADFDVELAVRNLDSDVDVVPRSGIRYSTTVPEPGAAALAAAVLSLAALARRRAVRRG